VNSTLVEALGLTSSPVAVVLAAEKPDDALSFREGVWGCVMATLIAVSKGRSAVYDRATFGCAGGGTALGFGNQYEECGLEIDLLLSTGSGEQVRRTSRMGEGERFFKSPEQVHAWLETVPFRDVPAEFVVLKPLELVAENETPEVVTFFVNPDQLSALVTMTDYERGTGDSVIAGFAAACQPILWALQEAESDHPRGVIGFFDISQRHRVDREVLTFTVPWKLLLEMERNVEGSFLQMEDWLKLRERQGPR
jgi:uncharacterized protein (DUF169 family)